MEIYIEHADGYNWSAEADNLADAQQIVENEAIAVSENCALEDIDDVFPMYWSITNQNNEVVSSGYVNERGEFFS